MTRSQSSASSVASDSLFGYLCAACGKPTGTELIIVRHNRTVRGRCCLVGGPDTPCELAVKAKLEQTAHALMIERSTLQELRVSVI